MPPPATTLDSPPSPDGTTRGLRILEVETYGRGGLAHYVDHLSRALAERGHRVTVLTAPGEELDESRPLPSGLAVERRLGRLSTWIARLPRFLQGPSRKLAAVLDACKAALYALRQRPDVVHLHCTDPAALVYTMLFRITRRPLVTTAHVVTPHEPVRFQSVLYRAIHRLPQRVVAHSDFDRRRLIDEFSAAPSRIAIVPHGEYGFFGRVGAPVDRRAARRDLGLESDAEVALFFGYLREYKGLDVLLAAWPEVARRRARARLAIAGDPVRLGATQRARLERRSARLGAVTHFGYVHLSDVASWIRAADILVLPYRRVSQSGVLYLALAHGLPVVATRIGAWEELLADGENALLVPSEDPEALAEAVARLLGDAALRERLAEGGRALADEHSWPRIAERTEAVFRDLGI